MSCKYAGKVFIGGSCKTNMGGIKNLWIKEYDVTEVFTVDAQGIATSTSTEKWKLFSLPLDIGDATEDVSADIKLGTSFVSQTINGTVLGLDALDSQALSKMMKTKQRILAELYNGKYILYGMENGLDITGGGSRTGAEAGSLQGYELTWTGREHNYAPEYVLDASHKDETVTP